MKIECRALPPRGEWHKYAGLQRAVSWFRKGIGASDIIDEYVYYWIALEALNDLLPQAVTQLPRAKCAKCKRLIDICPYCKDDPKVFATISPLYGIEQLAKDTGLSKEEFHDLRKLRAKIFHSGVALRVTRERKDTPLVKSIRTKIPIARNLLIDGLGKTLKLSKETIQQIKEHEPLKEQQAMRLRLKTYIQDINIGLLSGAGYPIHPRIEVPLDKMKVKKVLPNRQFVLASTGPANFNNCRQAQNSTFNVEVWSNMPTLEKAELLLNVQKHDNR